MKETPPNFGELLRWLDMKQHRKTTTNGSFNDIFDLGCQISDDAKNKNFNNGFLIYDNDGKIRIYSVFKDKAKCAHMSNELLKELVRYLTELNNDKH